MCVQHIMVMHDTAASHGPAVELSVQTMEAASADMQKEWGVVDEKTPLL